MNEGQSCTFDVALLISTVTQKLPDALRDQHGAGGRLAPVDYPRVCRGRHTSGRIHRVDAAPFPAQTEVRLGRGEDRRSGGLFPGGNQEH